jgi:hypothetical protein
VSRFTARLPRAMFGYNDRLGPPVGSMIQVHGQEGRVAAVREIGDEVEVDVEVDGEPDTLTGVPHPVSEDQLALEEDR